MAAMVYPVGTVTNARGHLEIGGCDVVELAAEFGFETATDDESAFWASNLDLVSITSPSGAHLANLRSAADHGVDVVVAEVAVRYRAPARFDEELQLDTWFDAIGSTSMTARCDVRRGEELLAEGTVRYVMVETAGWTKTPVPSALRVALGHAP